MIILMIRKIIVAVTIPLDSGGNEDFASFGQASKVTLHIFKVYASRTATKKI